MKISVATLQSAISSVLNQMIKEGVTDIELKKDYYWSIPSEDKYDPYHQPQELTLGQLIEDWKEVCQVASGEHEAERYQINAICSILQYIASDDE